METLISLMSALKLSLVRLYLPLDQVPTTEQLARLADLQMDLYRRVAEPRVPRKGVGR